MEQLDPLLLQALRELIVAPDDLGPQPVEKRTLEPLDQPLQLLPKSLAGSPACERLGTLMRFLLPSLSPVVVSTRSRVIVFYGQIVSIAFEAKKRAKKTPGSSYFIDRRQQ